MEPSEKIKNLATMLSATAANDTGRLLVTAHEIIAIAMESVKTDQVDIIHKRCGKRIEDCSCPDAEVVVVGPEDIGELNI